MHEGWRGLCGTIVSGWEHRNGCPTSRSTYGFLPNPLGFDGTTARANVLLSKHIQLLLLLLIA